MKKIIYIFFILIISCNSEKESTPSTKNVDKKTIKQEKSPIFEKIPSSQSKLNFSNNITENLETLENLFSFDYFYNGAGVGVEDLNNDGLLDVFFCGNQVPNKLFLNKGNLEFKDISASSGINDTKHWSNGITFVDINNDGYKDIYISQGGPNERVNRKNVLLINNKDLTFTDKAEDYGLADMGISTQTAFFDFDQDGDLDCIVMNENEIYGVDPVNFYKLINKNDEIKYFNSSHLYENDNGKFVDITQSAGIENPIFGLGLCISDINKDGWLDMYLTSDYYIPDALYINQHDGTFKESIKEYTQHISYYGMGIDIADINADSKQDIFTLDMSSSDHIRSKTLMASMNPQRFNYLVNTAGFHYQYMFNSLQLNLGNNKYNNIAQLTETANTDWSWSVLMSDFDNDQDNDIYISNGYRKYALDNDLQNKVYAAKRKYGGNVPYEIKEQLYASMPSEKLSNILYTNEGNLSFTEEADQWGLNDYSFSNGVAQADLDNDGDLDLIVNNMDEEAFLYKNTTIEKGKGNYLKIIPIGDTSEPFCKVEIRYNGKAQFAELKRVRGYMSSQENGIHFGLGDNTQIDTLSITWLNGKRETLYNIDANSTVQLDINNATEKSVNELSTPPIFNELKSKTLGLDYTHIENEYDDFASEILLPYKQSTFGPFVSLGDLNADGLTDIFIGGSSNQPACIYYQTNRGYRKSVPLIFQKDKSFEDMESIIFDMDNDNDLDIYVVSGGNEFQENSSLYQDRIYLNNGKGEFTKSKDPALVAFAKNGKSVEIIDYDKDGDMDILVGNRSIPKKYPQHSSSTLYENIDGVLKDVTKDIAPQLEDFGIINSIISTDYNNDGWQDFIAVGEWTGIGFFRNENGTFTLDKISPLLEQGWWFSIQETDINNDGLKDYVVGNVGLNLKFKANTKKPFKIYSNDFDNNGTNDVVLSKEYKGKYVPVRGRECSSQQMPFIKNKFKSYSSFANASLEDIYGENLENSYSKEVTNFQSLLLINQGEGKFQTTALPIEAQQFPILSSVFIDLNNDGFEDCIVAGNIFETEVETPRLDAISGLVLISNQKDGYDPMPYEEAGLYFTDNLKDMIITEYENKPLIICTNNNNEMYTYNFTPN
ncbi:VCBS repeat-containing protein [Maribacter confluentis]|uniref:VCBS repeat-containing protein n=1 Tax=Maribacter confluentis TaxID=1656093 RepID=A0ABT8RU29_9FLAO|nr:VCBS repeat-containing protein [Maribacter confluentis]MDO1513586.1 VCBS repeat-containing protein [Maribacter confluentis]